MNQGFFQSEIVNRSCTSCGVSCRLLQSCHSPKMPVSGQGKMKILVVAEAPGKEDDLHDKQLIGPAGQVLREALQEFGVDLDRDCRKTNAVRCRPPENRKPTTMEIASCQPHIWEEIKENSPKLIILLGQVAVESFLYGRVKSPGMIGRWRGFVIPDQKAGCWIAPTFHPSYILRSREGRAIRGKAEPDMSVEGRTFMWDLENALGHLRKPFPVAPVPEVEENKILVASTIAIDFETTGLRPWQIKTHQVLSAGICYDDSTSRAVSMNSFTSRQIQGILSDPTIKKIGHNIKFEHQWAKQCLGVETKGWIWDTMQAAHCLDNRRGICGLKHQIYLNFGVESWGKDFDFDENPIQEVTDELLTYNALDAFWTFQLYKKQKALFK